MEFKQIVSNPKILGGKPVLRDEPSLVAEVRHGRETLALLPTRVRPREEPVRDDF